MIVDYMLTDKLIDKIVTEYKDFQKIQKSNSLKKINENNKNNKNKLEKIYFDSPIEKDKLFWCYYIMKYGELKYEMLENKSIVIERKLKIDLINLLRQNKDIIKQYKFATLTHIENQLANENIIDISTFFTLCVLEKINILFIHNKSYFESLNNDSSKIYILYNLDNSTYNVRYEETTIDKADTYKESLYRMESLKNPIQAFSNYKLDELVEINLKLGLDVQSSKKKTKKELYEQLVQYFRL
jgi:hypothetical protein